VTALIRQLSKNRVGDGSIDARDGVECSGEGDRLG
jgi:hypothetical protein